MNIDKKILLTLVPEIATKTTKIGVNGIDLLLVCPKDLIAMGWDVCIRAMEKNIETKGDDIIEQIIKLLKEQDDESNKKEKN